MIKSFANDVKKIRSLFEMKLLTSISCKHRRHHPKYEIKEIKKHLNYL